MKTAGIVCDNYKLEKFREKLEEHNISFKETPFVAEKTTTISCEVEDD